MFFYLSSMAICLYLPLPLPTYSRHTRLLFVGIVSLISHSRKQLAVNHIGIVRGEYAVIVIIANLYRPLNYASDIVFIFLVHNHFSSLLANPEMATFLH